MRKIPSKYSPGKQVHEAQYIVEILCRNNAKRNNIELPTKFWELEEWSVFFKMQILWANKYLKQYGFSKLLSFINSKNIYMLQPKWIADALEKYSVPEIDQTITFESLNLKSTGRVNKNKEFDYLN